ncbi:uncharacterized protein LOC142166784 [Nicotiana tabacum]|uniref:Uncharacterized protein LOC142166784 n=1 Tax=Nicotiana tabacum TaxID=4097 RepID=A0AC58SB02_TOBAC
MPFGLKNAGATYQRLVNKMFEQQIGKTMEVYIDDMLVKSLNAGDHLNHLREIFDILRKYNMKLNPEKCAFGVGSETYYPHLKKLALALVIASQKLSLYFQCHPIAAVITLPLRNVLHKPELSGHLAKCAVEVSEFDIEYKPITTIKPQVLADFVDDFTPGLMPLAAKDAVSGTVSCVWTLFTDGASNINGSSLVIVLITPSGETLRQAIRIISLTNNEAEYEALVAGLELVRQLGPEVIEIKCDSQLVVNQVYGIFDTKEEHMQQYLSKVQVLLSWFREWSIIHILREENVEADALANLVSSTKMEETDSGAVNQLLHSVLDVYRYCKLNLTNLIWDWRNEFIEHLRHGKFPEDPKLSWALRTKAAHYCLIDCQLYRKSFQ